MNLEQDLRRALERTDPPLDFTHRVLAEVQRETTQGAAGPAPVIRRFPAMQWLAAAAAMAIMATGGVRYYDHQQKVAEAKRVEADIRLAMQITSDALSRVQLALQETNR